MTSPAVKGAAPLGAWQVGQFLQLCATQAFASIAIGVAWFGTSRTGLLSQQINWVILAIAGLALAVGASISWLLVARRRIGYRRAHCLDRLLPDSTGDAFELDDEIDFVSTDLMTHYHLPSCQLVRGKAARADSLAAHLGARRSPCAVCRP